MGEAERHAALIVNTQARRGQEGFARAQEVLKELGVEVDLARGIDEPEQLIPTVHQAVDTGHNPIIVGGGDGSISGAANVLARHKNVVLGIIPLGTANDFAHTLGIPEDVAEACTVIARGAVVEVDLGCAGDTYYLNLASIGLAGEVTKVLPHWLKRIAGPLAYPVSTAYAFLHYEPFDATLAFPNGDHPPATLRRLLQLGVGNGHYYGGGMVVAPDANPDDGLLDVYAIELGRWRNLLSIAAALKSGEYVRRPGVHYYRTTAADVQTNKPLEITADGEVDGTTPQRFSIATAALCVLAPHARRRIARRRSRRSDHSIAH